MTTRPNDSKYPAAVHELEADHLSRLASKKLSRTGVITVAVIAFAVAVGLVPRWLQQGRVKAETLALATPSVAVVNPKPLQGGVSQMLPAEIKPWAEAPIYARANGYLKQRFVDIGDVVEEGQLLAEIDTPELHQDLERTRALLAQAEVTQRLARVTAERWASLRNTASVSEQENAEKQADFNSKAATVASARAEMRRLEQLQSFSRVTAPFAGTVTARNIDTGDLIVAAGGKELFHLAQTRKLRVTTQVPQATAGSIHPGQAAEMILPERPGQVFKAQVVRTAGMIAADSRTLLVELEADNADGGLTAGSYAQVRFPEAKLEAVLTLPANSVTFRAEGPQIALVQADGTVLLRGIKLGRDFGQTMEVVSGVTASDRVIINPQESLVSGTAVNVSAATEAANNAGGKP